MGLPVDGVLYLLAAGDSAVHRHLAGHRAYGTHPLLSGSITQGAPAARAWALTIHSSRSRFAARLNSGVRRANRSTSDVPHKKESKPIPELEIPGLGLVKPGTRVRQSMLGSGVVKDIAQWADGSHTVQVDFEARGLKWLVPQYANLLPD